MSGLVPESRASSLHVQARELADALRAGDCPSDVAFDSLLPYALRRASEQHWTPLRVVTRVAAWLEGAGAGHVVDVGSGAGKFCVVAALGRSLRVTGVEHRPRCVEAARELARVFEVQDRVRFVESALDGACLPNADAYYFYNPFGENVCRPENQLDRHVELGAERYQRDVRAVEGFIGSAPRGTLLVTYNGYGGRVPDSYEEVRVSRDLPYVLRMWRKTRQASGRVLRRG